MVIAGLAHVIVGEPFVIRGAGGQFRFIKSTLPVAAATRRAAMTSPSGPWAASAGALCDECQKLPPILFEPGSSATHRLLVGPGGVPKLRQGIQGGCRLCITVSDALRAGPNPTDLALPLAPAPGEDGVLLSTEWTPLRPGEHTTRKHTWSSENSNRLVLESSLGIRKPSSPPLLTLTWGKSNSRSLRFNVRQTAPSTTSKATARREEFRTTWDNYNKDFEVPGLRGLRGGTAHIVSEGVVPTINFQLLSRWLDECQQNHQKCAFVGDRVLATGFSLPTRLIYCGQDGPLRLVDASDIPRNEDGFGPPYTALSYRWGDPSLSSMTTKANVVASMKGLKFEDLPLTLQHAIEITREIKVAYIWIDALCIVQDDEASKEREVSTMDLIYSMAICLISASASPNTRAGFLPPSAPDNAAVRAHVQPFTLNAGLDHGSLSVTIQPYLADWGNALTNGPVYSRGWCFQERQLSKRLVHFTEKQMLWECRTSVASEDHPAMVSLSQVDLLFTPNWPPRITVGRTTDVTMLRGDPRRTRAWYVDWCRVIEAYSGRTLSFPTDRLPALAGLAAFFEMKLGITEAPGVYHYLAGLWMDDFAMGLAWFPNHVSRQSLQPGEEWPPPLRTASKSEPIGKSDFLRDWHPSWSWIAQPGAVRYPYLDGGKTDRPGINSITLDFQAKDSALPLSYFPFKLTGSSVTFASRHTMRFGAISGSYVCLTSRLAVITLSEGALIKNPDLVRPGPRPKLYSMYRRPVSSLLAGALGRRRPVSADGIIYFDVDPPSLPSGTEIHCLRLGTGPSLFSETDGAVDFGLALLQVRNTFSLDLRGGVIRMDGSSTAEPFPRMRRVGMFEVDVWNDRWPKDAVKYSVVVV